MRTLYYYIVLLYDTYTYLKIIYTSYYNILKLFLGDLNYKFALDITIYYIILYYIKIR